LQRNRLIAAMTGATVVVEAAWRSGALSTAHHAARLLRPVGAVPGPVTSVASSGCHRLLREGTAVCVTDADEVAELVGPLDGGPGVLVDPVASNGRDALDGLDPAARAVHEALSVRVASSTAQVVGRTGRSAASVRACLGRLDVAGLVVQEGDGWKAVRVTTVQPRGFTRPVDIDARVKKADRRDSVR
jgi:DNA processing protein